MFSGNLTSFWDDLPTCGRANLLCIVSILSDVLEGTKQMNLSIIQHLSLYICFYFSFLSIFALKFFQERRISYFFVSSIGVAHPKVPMCSRGEGY